MWFVIWEPAAPPEPGDGVDCLAALVRDGKENPAVVIDQLRKIGETRIAESAGEPLILYPCIFDDVRRTVSADGVGVKYWARALLAAMSYAEKKTGPHRGQPDMVLFTVNTETLAVRHLLTLS